jgi:hypothetical protein
MQWAMREDFFQEKGAELAAAFEGAGIAGQKLY